MLTCQCVCAEVRSSNRDPLTPSSLFRHVEFSTSAGCSSSCVKLSRSLPPSLPPCLSVSLSLSLCVSVSMHPEAEEGFKELSKISDRETWPGTILKRYQNDNRNNGKVVICEYLAIPFSSYSSKMESYVRCATCSRKASGQLPLVRSCVTGPSQSVGGRLKSFQPS